MNQGKFYVFEGIDGAGTTTQSKRFADRLRESGREVYWTAQPSMSPVGVIIRHLIKVSSGRPNRHQALALAFASDRLLHYDRAIRPALDKGTDVVCDRYTLSSYAYQAVSSPLAWLRALNEYAPPEDLTFFVSVPVEEALERVHAREMAKPAKARREFDLYENAPFLRRVDANYRAFASLRFGVPWVEIDGRRSIDEVAEDVWAYYSCWDGTEAREVA